MNVVVGEGAEERARVRVAGDEITIDQKVMLIAAMSEEKVKVLRGNVGSNRVSLEKMKES